MQQGSFVTEHRGRVVFCELSNGDGGTIREWKVMKWCDLYVVVEHSELYLCAKFCWSGASNLEIMAVAGFLHLGNTTFHMISADISA